VSQPIMDFCPSQPTRRLSRLSRLSLQGAFLIDNFNYGDRIIRGVVSCGRPDGDDVEHRREAVPHHIRISPI
jgi:hypothetical protein